MGRLVETDGFAHRRLDVKGLDVLPVLLEQRHEEVDACARDISLSRMQGQKKRGRTQHDVGENLVVRHLNVADGDTQAKHLLELELDG